MELMFEMFCDFDLFSCRFDIKRILADVLIIKNGITEESGKRLLFLKYPIPEIRVWENISGSGRVLGTCWALLYTLTISPRRAYDGVDDDD